MEFHFGVVNTIATAVIILITLLNIIVYKLRQIQEANFKDILEASSRQFQEARTESLNRAAAEQLQDEIIEENPSLPSSSLGSRQLGRLFPLTEILLATNNFDDALVIGRGGFGKVYKGVIDDGAVTVAIKRSNPMSRQGAPQFWAEVELLSRFRHSHVVSLIGYCYNPTEMILVYEYVPRGSLADHLLKIRTNLSWILRLKICIGAAEGLNYLHTGTGINDRVIHRDMKSSNILLDDSWAAKISDFGLSKIGPANQDLTHVSTNLKGTFGYFDPEYMTTRKLTRKSDVYSFGVVLLEVLSGKRAMDPKVCEDYWDLAAWAKERIQKKEVEQIIDPYLKHEILPNSLKEYVQIIEKCLQYRSRKRPTMAEVVASLERSLALQERMDSTMFEEAFANLGWTHSTEVNDDAGNGGVIEREATNDVGLPAISQLQRSRITLLKRMARLFKVKPRVSSDLLGAVNEASNSESSIEFNFDTLLVATDNFSVTNKIGAGETAVYKGRLQDGTVIVVKKLDKNLSLPESDFQKRMSVMTKLQHRNLAKLIGFSWRGTERLLVYPFYANSSLDNFIHDPRWYPSSYSEFLDWEQCTKIIKGVLRGIIYLHKDFPERIIHRDLKPSHILLDEEMTPKISGFGMAMPPYDGESGITTTICGTVGYIPPECFHCVSEKSDVYSFGICILNITSGLPAHLNHSDGSDESLQHYALRVWRAGTSRDMLIRPNLSSSSENTDDISRCIHIALLCTQRNDVLRPTMSEVLFMLENPSLSLPEPSMQTMQYSLYDELSSFDYEWPTFVVNEDSSCESLLTEHLRM